MSVGSPTADCSRRIQPVANVGDLLVPMRDFRYAFRSLWRQKSFAATAVVTLAIGLGANTALFGLVSAALRPMSVPDADQIVTIAAETLNDDSGGFQYTFSTEALKDFQVRT